ncbi:MAG TPA: dehydrogenase, partial [Planctomycetota bacterium]|nr:dehydrogenase [Planctomycetota bacterium]
DHIYREIDTIASRLHHGGQRWTAEHFAVSDELGGGHAHCGAMVYLGDSFPEEYRGAVFMNNIHGNRVNVDALVQEGSGWVGHCRPDFLFANDKWYRGIALRYGPDGSVFITDWYDQQACHLTNPLVWDRTNGRVYNVSYGDPKPVVIDVRKLSDDELVELQLHRNDWHVRNARRILQERGPNSKVHAALEKHLFAEKETPRRLRALWALHVTGGIGEATLEKLLADADAWIRAWAVRLACEDREVSQKTAERFAALATNDASPIVRLSLASALQRLPADKGWPVARGLASHASDAKDHNLPSMLWYGLEPLVAADPARGLELAETAATDEISRFIVRRASSDVGKLDPVLAALERSDDKSFRTVILEEMARAFEGHARLEMPAGWRGAFEALRGSDDPHVRELVRAISVKFGDRRIFPELRAIVSDRSGDLAARGRALKVLLDGEDPDLVPVLTAILDEASLRGAAIRGLARYSDGAIPGAILAIVDKLAPAERLDAISTLASRPEWARTLLEAVRDGKIARTDVSAFVVRQIKSFGDDSLVDLVTEVWGEVRETSEEKAELIAAYRAKVSEDAIASADPSRGRHVFASTCAQCHTLFGAGGTIAPDLTGSNRRDIGYLLENLLDPNAVVGKDYQLEIFILKDSRVVSGL